MRCQCCDGPLLCKYGMLIPNDSSAQYDFSEREVEDLNLILKMRKHQFKLKEIQQYLILTRHSE